MDDYSRRQQDRQTQLATLSTQIKTLEQQLKESQSREEYDRRLHRLTITVAQLNDTLGTSPIKRPFVEEWEKLKREGKKE